MVSFEIISLLVFVALIGLLLLKDRKNVSFKYGIIMRRWTKGIDIVDKIVRRYPRFITVLGNIGVVAGFIAGIVGLIVIVSFTINFTQAF